MSIDIVLRWYVIYEKKSVWLLVYSWLFVVVPLERVFHTHPFVCLTILTSLPLATNTHIHTTKYQYRTPTLDCQEFTTVYNCKENDDMLPAKTSTSGGCWLNGKLVGVPTYQPTEEPTTPLYVIAILKVYVSRLCILTRLLCLSFVF